MLSRTVLPGRKQKKQPKEPKMEEPPTNPISVEDVNEEEIILKEKEDVSEELASTEIVESLQSSPSSSPSVSPEMSPVFTQKSSTVSVHLDLE